MFDLFDRLEEAVTSLGEGTGAQVPITGLLVDREIPDLIDMIETERFVPWQEIPHVPAAAPGSGLTFGIVDGRPVAAAHAISTGRAGSYAADAAWPPRLLHLIGVRQLIICGRAGRLADHLERGGAALVTDHLNLTGDNPLIGPNDDRLGPRFPDMTAAYSPRLNGLARSSAIAERIPLHEGILAAVAGQESLPGGELARLRALGADLVGTGVVHEVTAAVHLGMEVAALLAITGTDQGSRSGPEEEEHRDLKEAGLILAGLVRKLISEI